MALRDRRRLAFSILIGLVVTTVTGLNLNSNLIGELPNVQFITQPWLGVSYWGYILPWLKQVVYPGMTKQVIWQNFVADVVIWTIVAYIVLTIFKVPTRASVEPVKSTKHPSKTGRRR